MKCSRDDKALRGCVNCYLFFVSTVKYSANAILYLANVKTLLEDGANIHCNNGEILKCIQKKFDHNLAHTLLPYCCEDDYHHFPSEYILENVVATKSARRVKN